MTQSSASGGCDFTEEHRKLCLEGLVAGNPTRPGESGKQQALRAHSIIHVRCSGRADLSRRRSPRCSPFHNSFYPRTQTRMTVGGACTLPRMDACTNANSLTHQLRHARTHQRAHTHEYTQALKHAPPNTPHPAPPARRQLMSTLARMHTRRQIREGTQQQTCTHLRASARNTGASTDPREPRHWCTHWCTPCSPCLVPCHRLLACVQCPACTNPSHQGKQNAPSLRAGGGDEHTIWDAREWKFPETLHA